MPSRIHVECVSSDTSVPATRSVRTWVRAALAQRRDDAELSVRIVDEEEMRELNSRYRNKNHPTNVLAFPAGIAPELGLPLLGDIVVCAPVVRREALEQNKPARAHWAHMLIHGTLHLLGHDHVRPRQASVMETLEIRILESLGFPDPYLEH
jgi:probable rRNA maturation factor